MILDELEKAYLAAKGTQCPACKSADIEGGSFEADGGYCWQHVKCSGCGAEWEDVYSLAGINNLEIPGGHLSIPENK